jgi:hypothetical protein
MAEIGGISAMPISGEEESDAQHEQAQTEQGEELTAVQLHQDLFLRKRCS